MVSLLLPVQMKFSLPVPPPPSTVLMDREETEGVGVRVPELSPRAHCEMALPSLAKLTGSLLRLLLLLLLEVVVVVVVATGLDWSMMVHSDSWTRLSSRSQ